MGFHKMDGTAVGQWGFAWNVLLDDTMGFEMGAASLAALMCGNPNAFSQNWCWGVGWLKLFGVGADSEVMMIGYSNGAGLATFALAAYSMVTSAVAIDYHAYSQYEIWIPIILYSGGFTTFQLKVYTNCKSHFYSTEAIVPPVPLEYTLIMAAGLSIAGSSPYYEDYGGWGYGYLPYKEFYWTGPNNKYLKFAVHGLDASNGCTRNVIAWGNQMLVHLAMPYWAGWLTDVLAWVGTGTPPAAPSPPPGNPMPPSPAPPPFPPTSGWFLPIKPIRLPVAIKPSDLTPDSSGVAQNFGGELGLSMLAMKEAVKTEVVCVPESAIKKAKAADSFPRGEKGAPGGGPPRGGPPGGGPPGFGPPGFGPPMHRQMMAISGGISAKYYDWGDHLNIPSEKAEKAAKNTPIYMDAMFYKNLAPEAMLKENQDLHKMALIAAAPLWEEDSADATAPPVPTFYFDTVSDENFVFPTVPAEPDAPDWADVETCPDERKQTIDTQASASSLSLAKLDVLKTKLDSNFGPRRAIA